jgi:alginate O-acetyltransferase complex protein AlgI
MGFNSFAFIALFLPIVAAIYRALVGRGRLSGAKMFLLAASLFFYSQSGLRNIPYLLASLLFNYGAARAIHASQGAMRKRWLIFAVIANVAFLGSFKYANFIFGGLLRLPTLAFPLGVSFFTIQQIMYLVDCYEEISNPNTLLDHAVFASFFPYITAGPIARAREIVPQLNTTPPRPVADDVAKAITLFAIGLFKKVVFADAFMSIADAGFSQSTPVALLAGWISAFGFTLQIYFDFSGYSDMAVAAAMLLGIRIPKNFDNPLRSLSITEFWRRWHISLSNFITTYLYTPIVKSFGRATLARSMTATITAMIIAGLWHGSAWTFVVFGAMHGAALGANQYWKKKKRNMPNAAAWVLTMVWVTLAFVFFRSPNLSSAIRMFAGLAGLNGWGGLGALAGAVGSVRISEIAIPVLAGSTAAFLGPASNNIADNFQPSPAMACAVAGMLVIAALFMNSTVSTEFVYVAF